MRYCKVCGCEVGAQFQYCESCGKEVQKINIKKWQKTHPEQVRAYRKKYQALWIKAHPDQKRAYTRKATRKYRERKKHEMYTALMEQIRVAAEGG